MLIREAGIGRAGGEQADSGLAQIGAVLFQADQQIPAHLACQFEHGGLRVESIQQENIEEPTAIEVGYSGE
jgi:hypothetical protein